MKKMILAGFAALAGAAMCADVKPLLWMDDLKYLNAGEKSAYINGNASPVKSENGQKYVTVKNCRGVMQGLPRGDVFGDYEVKFSFRPKSERWSIETMHHFVNGGSRRFRKDPLINFGVKITSSQITIGAKYADTFEEVAGRTSPPRLIGADLPPFPKIESGEYPLDPEIFGDGKKWIDTVITVDQYKFAISFNGKTVMEHKINPACGTMGMFMLGEVDVRDIVVYALRPGVDPFADENLMKRDYSKHKHW